MRQQSWTVWLKYFTVLVRKYLKKIVLDIENQYVKFFLVDVSVLLPFFQILKKHLFFKFTVLTDIIGVDWCTKLDMRYELNYLLVSLKYNIRSNVAVVLAEVHNIPSSSEVFSNANWCEREIWDLFGIFFTNHNDLRRILTDYGFKGYPLRKEFPVNGFVEIRYDEDKQYLVYEKLELMQNLRFYDFINPCQKKYLI